MYQPRLAAAGVPENPASRLTVSDARVTGALDVTFSDPPSFGITSDLPRKSLKPGDLLVGCPRSSFRRLRVGAARGDDRVILRLREAAVVQGGPGADVLIAGPGRSVLDGGPGDDRLTAGPDGGDVLIGG